MASVIRVKRRRNEDPAEALILSQKKSRLESDENNDSKMDNVLQFAGTLQSKTEPVSSYIKEVIKTKKLHRELHPHLSESKKTADLITKVRLQNTQTSQNNRYHITCSKRALHIDTLDDVETSEGESFKIPSLKTVSGVGGEKSESKDSCNVEENISPAKDKESSDGSQDKSIATKSESVPIQQKEVSVKEEKVSNESKDNFVCLIDVEHHQEKSVEASSSASGITVNNVAMVSTKVAVPIEEESDDYVYDIYYSHTHIKDVEAILTVEAMCNELIYDNDEISDDDEPGDLDEDSNDEANWRNDYPDEDPGFYANEGHDYDYEDNMALARNFSSGYDEGDMLAFWMDNSCRIEVDCEDFVNDDGDDDRTNESCSDEYREDDDLYY